MVSDLKKEDPTTFEAFMNFMTAYVQNNQVPHDQLNEFISQTCSAVFNVADLVAVGDGDAPAAERRGRVQRTLVRETIQDAPSVSEAASAEDTESEAGEIAPVGQLNFLGVTGSAPVKRGRGRPKKNQDIAEVQAAQASGTVSELAPGNPADPNSPNYKFAHLRRTPFNDMDPEDAVQPDSITNLLDGAKMKFITRRLGTKYLMTPEEYRIHFGLRPDYPMTAPGYSKTRQKIMIKTQKDQKAKKEAGAGANLQVVSSAPTEAQPAKRRGRPPKAASAPKPGEAKVVKRGRRPKSEPGAQAA